MAGYSGTPLLKKLGLKSGAQCYVANAPNEYWDWLNPLPEGIKQSDRLAKDLDFIHLFVKEKKVFEKELVALKKQMKKDGMMWISWPKKSSKIKTDLDENVIRDFALKKGLVDVKVCAVDEIWSGLKLVYRLSDR